jgi:hypothetical protein
VATVLLSPLRVKPFRGDVVAAGVVVLTTLVWTVTARFSAAWGPGAHLAYAAPAWAFVTALAVATPLEDGATPRAYQSVLYVGSVALFVDVVGQLVGTLGAGGAAASAFSVAAVAVFSVAFAIRRNSAVCTLLGALAGGLATLLAIDWLFSPGGIGAFRWVLTGLVVVFGFLAIGQRDRRPRHGVALIDAAGLAILAIAVSFLVEKGFIGLFEEGTETGHENGVAWGWELLILATGFGLIAYSSVDRQPGPAYIGVLNLIAFTSITSLDVTAAGATLVGWPIALALAAAFLLVVGLRPTTPAPPPPDIDAPAPPPLPLR